jgi:hypothetical protein
MAFSLGSVTLDMGVSKDTGWTNEEIVAMHDVIGGNATIIQSSGFKSAVRTIHGTTKSISVKNALDSLYLTRANFTVIDHDGLSASARFSKPIQWDRKLDVTNLSGATYDFQIELIRR